MVLITLIGEPLAKIGSRFYYLGPQTECKECRLRSVCFNLEQGSLYEIKELRNTTHECLLTEDQVHVVEVEKVPIVTVVPKKSAIDGSIITFQAPECARMDCENYPACHPSLENGRKCSIVEVGKDIDCPIDEKIVSVKVL